MIKQTKYGKNLMKTLLPIQQHITCLQYKHCIEDNGYARSVDIARELDITAGSCSTWLKSLLKKWLIEEDKNKFILLSETGKHAVEKITKNRKLFIDFFTKILWAKDEEAIITACKIEHLISNHISRKLEKFLNSK